MFFFLSKNRFFYVDRVSEFFGLRAFFFFSDKHLNKIVTEHKMVFFGAEQIISTLTAGLLDYHVIWT